MLPAWVLLASALSTPTFGSPPPSGARLIVTQALLDALRDAGLPAALAFIQKFPIPGFETDQYSFKINVDNVKLSNVNAGALISLQEPGMLELHLSNLKLGVSAHVSAREDVWPNPSASGDVTADADGTSASITLSVPVDGTGVPALVVNSCSVDVHINNLAFHGLGILDPIIDWVGGFFTGEIRSVISDLICKTGMQDLLNAANPFLRQLPYISPFSFLPAPFNSNEVDWHIAGAPRVVSGSEATFLAVAIRGEVSPTGGGHDPNATLPVMPDPTTAKLRMATLAVNTFPFNTALWSCHTQGQLTYLVTPSILPSSASGVLNTAFYRLLMPKLYNAFPNANMTLNVQAGSCPYITIAGGELTLSGGIKLGFQVQTASGPVAAFEVVDNHFETTVTLGTTASPPAVTGEIENIALKFEAGTSAYGKLVPELLAFLSTPLNAIVNGGVLPLVNNVLRRGYPVPSIATDFGGYKLTIKFSQPEIDLSGGTYVLVGTDVTISLVPP